MSEIVPLNYCQETIDLKRAAESCFIALGERLAIIKDQQLWQSQWTSFSEYLSEMNINDSTASKMISVYKLYVGKFNIDETTLVEAGWEKLYIGRELLDSVNDTTQAVEIVKKITMLKRDDTREIIREQRNGVCHHDFFELHLRQCRVCAKKEQIHG